MHKIFIVDDDETTMEVLTVILEDAGYATVSAYDGSQVEKMIISEPPDLLLIDLVMPDQEGVEVIMKLRKKNKTLPIIAMSSFNQSYLTMAEALGANKSIAKPIDRLLLLSHINALLD